MEQYRKLYKKMVDVCVKNRMEAEFGTLEKISDEARHHLDCLLNPKNYPPVIPLGDCPCSDEQKKNAKRVANLTRFPSIQKEAYPYPKMRARGAGLAWKHAKKRISRTERISGRFLSI